MAEHKTGADGKLTREQEIAVDIERIQEAFAQLEFGRGRTIQLPNKEALEPMLAQPPAAEPTPVIRWRHNGLSERGGERREDLYAFLGGLGGDCLIIYRDDLADETARLDKGEIDQILPNRQQLIDHLTGETSAILGVEAQFHEVRAVMVAAHMAVGRALATA